MKRLAALFLLALVIAGLVAIVSCDPETPDARPADGAAEATAPDTTAPGTKRPRRRHTAPGGGGGLPLDVIVLDATDHKPLSGARVTLSPTEPGGAPDPPLVVVTGSDGRAHFDDTQANSVVVTAACDGHLPATDDVGLRDAMVTLELIRGAPIEGAAVRIWRLSTEEEVGQERRTDADGTFRIDSFPVSERYLLHVTHPGFAPLRELRYMLPGKPLELTLGGGGTIEGTVFRHDGTAAAEAPVHVFLDQLTEAPGDDESEFTVFVAARTDTDGRYRIDGVRTDAGRVEVRARVAGYPATGVLVDRIAHGETVTRDLYVEANGTLIVDVRRAGPRSTEKVVSVVSSRRQGFSDRRRRIPGPQRYDRLKPDVYAASVRDGRSSVATEVLVAPNDVARVSLLIGGDANIAGVVVDSGGRPIDDVDVQFESDDGVVRRWASGRTDESGRFLLGDLPAGVRGTLHISHWDFGDNAPAREVTTGASGLRLVLHRNPTITARVVPPFEDVEYFVSSETSVTSATAEVREDGSLVPLEIEPDEPTWIVFQRDGMPPAVFRDIVVGVDQTRDLGTIQWDAAHVIEGRVVDPNGDGIDARVEIIEPWMREPTWEQSGPDGGFELPPVPNLPTLLRVSATGYATTLVLVESPGSGDAVVVAMELPGRVRVRVVDAGGSARAAVTMRFYRTDLRPSLATWSSPKGATGTDGLLVMSLPPGTYRANVIEDDEYVLRGPEFTIGADAETGITLRLD